MSKLSTLAAISLLACAAGCAAQTQTWPVRVLPQEAPALAAPAPEASLLMDDSAALSRLATTSETSDARIGPPRGSGAGSRRVKLER